MSEYKKLQNGSDIRGVAMDTIPGENVTLTNQACKDLTFGFLKWLSEKKKSPSTSLKIAIGHDSRLSADNLRSIIIDTLTSQGVLVLNCGLSSTPAMFMSTIFEEFDCDGAIMITASHLPSNRNGFKYFDKDGGLNKGDISAIIEFAEANRSNPATICTPVGTCTNANLMDVYSSHLRTIIQKGVNHPTNYDKPLSGLHIVVDAGNGAGGFYVSNVLMPLGAETKGSQFLEPDGSFPNHMPNPENKEAMASLRTAVLQNHANLGIIFDTDVDRSSAVDQNGNEISRNAIVALAAALLVDNHPSTTVVTDSITSDGLHVFIEGTLGLKHHRFKRGYKNVINEAIKMNNDGIDTQLAIETSGHAAFKENYFLDDGAYLATKIVIKAAQMALAGQSLDQLISALKQPCEAEEFRLEISTDDYVSYGDEIIEALTYFAEDEDGLTLVVPNYEGVRIKFDMNNGNGWCLLRKSLHDPLMPLNIESENAGGIRLIVNRLLTILAEYEALNTASLREYANK